MNKNTKANLTLIFSVNKKNVNLESVLKSIQTQTDKNFNIIFAFNNAPLIDKEIIENIELSEDIDVQHVLFSESLGDSYTFNYCLKNVKTKYTYFLDSNVLLKPDFVATINSFISVHPDTDVLSFFGVPNYYFKEEYIEIKKLSDDFCSRPLLNFNNKVLNVEFLLKNNIREPMFVHQPLSYYVDLFIHKPVWYSISRQICSISNKYVFLFNILDLYDDCENLANLIYEKEYKDMVDELEYLILIGLLRNFVFTYFASNPAKPVSQKKVLKSVAEFLKSYIPNWRRNKWLWSKKNLNDIHYLDYLRDFKAKPRYILKEMKSESFKLRASGHEINK